MSTAGRKGRKGRHAGQGLIEMGADKASPGPERPWIALMMTIWQTAPHPDEFAQSADWWRIATQDYSECTFPSDERLVALFREHASIVDPIRVLRRVSNSVVIEIPRHTTPQHYYPFVRAVGEEMFLAGLK